MSSLLDIIDPDEFLPLVVLICLLCFLGGQFVVADTEIHRLARRLAAAAFMLYGLCGFIEWLPDSAWGFLSLAIRSLLAAGMVFGLSLLVLPVTDFTYQHTVGRVLAMTRKWSSEATRLHEERRAQREAEVRERRDREQRLRDAPRLERERCLAREEAERLEGERKAKFDDARAEVIRFYDEHEPLIRDSLPPALFRTQLQNQFPERMSPEQAWKAAQEMIAAMLPLIGQGREKQRTDETEQRKRAERARKLQREISKLEQQIGRLKASAVSDPDVVGQEVRAIEDQIKTLQEERESLEAIEKGDAP